MTLLDTFIDKTMRCNPARCGNGKCVATGECIDHPEWPRNDREWARYAKQEPPLSAIKVMAQHFGMALTAAPPVAPAAPRTIIAFTGLAGAGKSTAAAHLVDVHGFQRVRFAGPLKAMLAALGCSPAEIDGDLKETPCALLCGKTPRQVMQWIGTELGRDLIGPDLWIRAWEAALAKVPEGVPVVVDDVRFPNEVEAINGAGGVLVRIERPGAGTSSKHVSEQHQLPPSFILGNTATPEMLCRKVNGLVAHIAGRVPHLAAYP